MESKHNQHMQELEDDRDLAERCRAGDERAREQLVDRYLNQVQLTVARLVGPTQELPDVVQDALTQVLLSLKHYRGEALLRTWIDRVCSNVAYQHLRKRSRRGMVPLELVAEPPDLSTSLPGSAENRLHGRRLTRKLHAVLDTMDARKRVAFLLHAVLGYSVSEVAVMTGCRYYTAKSRIRYARRDLLRFASRDPELKAWLEERPGREG
ncbi:MAG: RNA polymerase sigma factor [bacterium]